MTRVTPSPSKLRLDSPGDLHLEICLLSQVRLLGISMVIKVNLRQNLSKSKRMLQTKMLMEWQELLALQSSTLEDLFSQAQPLRADKTIFHL